MSIITLIFLSFLLIHFCYYLGIFRKFSFSKVSQKNSPRNLPPVSVVICAKNEAQNLQKHLPLVLQQKYDEFEVIVINDRSIDDTLDLLENLAKEHNNLKVIDVVPSEHFHGNKKYALTLGIKAAEYETLLFTDADCIPKDKFWVQNMVQSAIDKKIVLGYGAYKTIRKSFLNKLIRFETILTALQYFSYAKIGIPYMGVGRNLLYKKRLFFKNKGFNSHINTLSGDDDLFINQVANKENTTINYTDYTISEPKTTLKGWLRQKRRHITTAGHYKKNHQFLLGLFAFQNLMIWLIGLLGITLPLKLEETYIFVSGLVLRVIVEWVIIGMAAKKLKEKKISLWVPLLSISLLFIHLAIFTSNLLKKPQRW